METNCLLSLVGREEQFLFIALLPGNAVGASNILFCLLGNASQSDGAFYFIVKRPLINSHDLCVVYPIEQGSLTFLGPRATFWILIKVGAHLS